MRFSRYMPERMSKIRILVLDEYLEKVLTTLQNLESVHFVSVGDRLVRWEKLVKPYEIGEQLKSWQNLSSRLADILGDLKIRRNLGLLEQLFMPRTNKLIETTIEEDLILLRRAEEIIETLETDTRDKISKYQAARDFLLEMKDLKINTADLKSSSRLNIVVGTATVDNVPLIQSDLEKRLPHSALYLDGKARRRYLVIISLKMYEEEISEIIAERGIRKIEIPLEVKGTPSQALRYIDDKTNEVIKKNSVTAEKLYDAINSKIERLKCAEKLGKSERICVIEGWVPEERSEEVTKAIQHASEGHAEILLTKPDEPESEIPTKLGKRKVVSYFNIITEMYGIPKYNEVDPTPVIGVFFTFFVGLMINSIALGLILLAGGILIVRGAGTRSQGMADLGKILTLSGISAIVFGVLTGEFAGGALEMFSNGQITLPIIWMSPADEPINFMIVVIAIGVIHLTMGLVLGIMNNYANHRIRDLIGDQISILLLFTGGVILVLTGQYQFEGYGILGYSTVVCGLGALLVGKGMIGLLELTKIISNVISYVRILALNMATTWMSRTFVLLAGMLLGIPYVGVAISIVLIVFAQFFLIFISSFSTFAHSMRLHFVEFFGRFFSGGGTKFAPLKYQRDYTKIMVR